ncbi:hypothetical protein Cst_c25030 [Thermoclostridium stercorarium subsp. stercorarium DSM 8532]|uniref:Uncharacterized protein n=1 Tax=Thermoclostridium stercorarium (strain ATCC 35414 / DSM 8532 / NCIMB 11754) TaxID=1121335 RepID=L7VMK9_THES1|nr:hypothetical protein Cst_c25030 [Thermoclostridium stercorarium subsp. stercorarium DSM 8532]
MNMLCVKILTDLHIMYMDQVNAGLATGCFLLKGTDKVKHCYVVNNLYI